MLAARWSTFSKESIRSTHTFIDTSKGGLTTGITTSKSKKLRPKPPQRMSMITMSMESKRKAILAK
jgi:hypothetical protein